VVLYGCQTWSLTLREEYSLKVFENRVLRRIFGLKRDEVTVGWRNCITQDHRNLYSSPSIIRIIKSGGRYWQDMWHETGVKRIAYKLLVGRPERKISLRIRTCRLVDNIRMDLGEIGWGSVDWIGLVQDRNQRRENCEHCTEFSGSVKC
jgi:hypothetical protein